MRKLLFVFVFVATVFGRGVPQRQQSRVSEILVELMQNEIDNISFILMEEIIRAAIENPEMLFKMSECISLDGSLEINEECSVMIIEKVTNHPEMLQRILNNVWEHSTMAKKLRSLTKQILVQAQSGELFDDIERLQKNISQILISLLQSQNELDQVLFDVEFVEQDVNDSDGTRELSEEIDFKEEFRTSKNNEEFSAKLSNEVINDSQVELN